MKRIAITIAAFIIAPAWIAWGAWHGLRLLAKRVKELIRG